MLIHSPYRARALKARAVQLGDPDKIADADIARRAAAAAKAIKAAVTGAPPLPAEVIDALRNLLPPVEPDGR